MPTIRVLDVETNGPAPPARVIEVGVCDLIQLGDGWAIDMPVSWLCGADEISPETRAVHHIQLVEVRGMEPFSPVGITGGEHLSACDVLAAHNAEFERQWFTPDDTDPIPWICTYKAALRLWPDAPSHSNGALRYWLEDQGLIAPEHDLTMPPHRAGPDAYVTAHLLKAMLVLTTAAQMARWTKEPKMLPRCPIGQEWRGKPWREVDTGFLQWVTRQTSMDPDIIWNASRALTERGL